MNKIPKIIGVVVVVVILAVGCYAVQHRYSQHKHAVAAVAESQHQKLVTAQNDATVAREQATGLQQTVSALQTQKTAVCVQLIAAKLKNPSCQ